MGKRDRRKKQQGRRSFLMSVQRTESFRAEEMRRWPVVRAYVPDPEAWRVGGVGTAGIVRRGPSGGHWTAFFPMQMHDGGMTAAFGAEDEPIEKVERDLAEMAEAGVLPPIVPGDAQLAARFIWGAYAFGMEEGWNWPPEISKRYLGMVPPLGGTRNWWRQQFIGKGGLVPRGLVELLEEHPVPDDLPEGKELAFATSMVLKPAGGAQALDKLRQAGRELVEQAAEGTIAVFHWMQKKKGWFGGWAMVATLRVEGELVRAEAGTLSTAAKVVVMIKRVLGTGVEVVDVKWEYGPPGFIAPGMTVYRPAE